jgi:hypothetical protein
VFVLTQALDNRSTDQCVLDNETHDANSAVASANVERLSEVLRTGTSSRSGQTEFASTAGHVVIKASTSELDSGGRRAPVLILITRPELASPGAVCDLADEYAALLGRTIEISALLPDIENWVKSGKANGGPVGGLGRLLRRVGCMIWRAFSNN